MRKTIIIIGLFVAFLIIYFLQANFFSWFNIAGIKPNLFIILALFISLYAGIKVGLSCSLFMGLFLDLVLGKNLGINIVMFCLVAILGWLFGKNFSKDSRLTITLMVIAATALFEIGAYLLSFLIQHINVEILYFFLGHSRIRQQEIQEIRK